MLTSVSSVAAIARNLPSRSASANPRRSQVIEPSLGELAQLADGLGRDQGDAAVAGEQALDLLQPDLAAADDQAVAARKPQAGDVERRLEHPAHAALIADPALVLADAFLACI